ncbi:MAG: hypothetical protein QMC81_03705 [Thermoanaerobacterales bacterium]|nr:hypothetical protein [Bacillota bacterium]MDI6906586.1 hypothetical protein [Thermoanaerobacterales bacterium]
MIVQSLDDFTSRVRNDWLGSEIEVTKTEPIPPIRFQLRDARTVGWDDVDPAIRRCYPPGSRFFVLSGRDEKGDGEGPSLKALVIHAGEDAAFDVRPGRLVLLSDEEVVQVKRLH